LWLTNGSAGPRVAPVDVPRFCRLQAMQCYYIQHEREWDTGALPVVGVGMPITGGASNQRSTILVSSPSPFKSHAAGTIMSRCSLICICGGKEAEA